MTRRSTSSECGLTTDFDCDHDVAESKSVLVDVMLLVIGEHVTRAAVLCGTTQFKRWLGGAMCFQFTVHCADVAAHAHSDTRADVDTNCNAFRDADVCSDGASDCDAYCGAYTCSDCVSDG